MAVDWQNYTSPIIGTPTIGTGGSTGTLLGGGLTDIGSEIDFLGGIGPETTGLYPKKPETNALDFLGGFASNNWLGYAALAFGGYRAFRSRRVNLMTLGLLVYGLWAIGWISPSLLPRNSDGGINYMVLGLSAILPPAAAALVGGVSGVIISTLARTIFRRNRRRFRRYYRRFRSYRPRYRRRWRR